VPLSLSSVPLDDEPDSARHSYDELDGRTGSLALRSYLYTPSATADSGPAHAYDGGHLDDSGSVLRCNACDVDLKLGTLNEIAQSAPDNDNDKHSQLGAREPLGPSRVVLPESRHRLRARNRRARTLARVTRYTRALPRAPQQQQRRGEDLRPGKAGKAGAGRAIRRRDMDGGLEATRSSELATPLESTAAVDLGSCFESWLAWLPAGSEKEATMETTKIKAVQPRHVRLRKVAMQTRRARRLGPRRGGKAKKLKREPT